MAPRNVLKRVIGMDSNPYLAIAASLACGYLGMVNRIDPNAEAQGEVYREGEVLPRNLDEALNAFQADNPVREILGGRFQFYLAIKRAELGEFWREIPPRARQHLLLNV